MPWKGQAASHRKFELETGDVADEHPLNLIVDCNSTILYLTCDFSNADTFLRSALYSATTCYVLGRLRQLLVSEEDSQVEIKAEESSQDTNIEATTDEDSVSVIDKPACYQPSLKC